MPPRARRPRARSRPRPLPAEERGRNACAAVHPWHPFFAAQRLAGASLLVFANKQDIEGALTAEEIREVLELDKVTTRHWRIGGCSAYTGKGLIDGVDWIVRDIASRIFMYD